MFRPNKRPIFKPSVYETSARRTRRVPRWLVLLLFGIAIGAGGLWLLQSSYGPPRLSVLESQQLSDELSRVMQERLRLQNELDMVARDLELERNNRKALTEQLAQAQTALEPLRADIALFAAAMPADPRGGTIGVHAANFTRRGNQLAYHVLIMQAEAATQPFAGQLVMVVEGRYATGRTDMVTLDAQAVSLDRYQHFKGVAALPAGFVATRVTVRVLDPAERQRAMRILIVRGDG